MPRLLDATYESNWCSAVGALAGVLHALGGRLPLAHVSALSGHAFRLAIVTGPEGAIDAEGVNHFAVAPAAALYENLGWRFAAIDQAPGAPDFEVLRETALTAIRRSIDRGRPAIVYGLHLPEFGIVRGYEGDAVYASTIMSPQYGERIPVAQWPAPGRELALRAFLPDAPVKLPAHANVALGRTLAFAVRYAQHGEPEDTSGAATGFAAFDTWAQLLESGERLSGRGQAYVVQALQAGRKEAAEFLRFKATRLPDLAPALNEAAAAYTSVVLELSRLATLFPFPSGGDVVSVGTRKAGAGYVRRAQVAEKQAVLLLERVLPHLPEAEVSGRGRRRLSVPLSFPWRRR